MKKNNFNYFKNKFKPEKSFSLLGEDILIKSFFSSSLFIVQHTSHRY